MPTKTVYLSFVLVFIVAYSAGFATRPNPVVPSTHSNTGVPSTTEPVPSIGPHDSPVVVIEVVDYNCSACRRNAKLFKRLVVEHSDVLFLRKHLPLGLWATSKPAAVAAMAAARQGRFWEFQDALYVNSSDNWTTSTFENYAMALGLDLEKFRKDCSDPAVKNHVEADAKAFERLNIRMATPTIWINGAMVKMEGLPADARQFRRLIEQSRRKVLSLVESGKAQSVIDARNQVAADNHPAGETFVRYFMNHNMSDLL